MGDSIFMTRSYEHRTMKSLHKCNTTFRNQEWLVWKRQTLVSYHWWKYGPTSSWAKLVNIKGFSRLFEGEWGKQRGKLQIRVTFIWFKRVCLSVSWIYCGDDQRVKETDFKDEGSPGEGMKLNLRHIENTHMGHEVLGKNSVTTTLCHEFEELSEEFI